MSGRGNGARVARLPEDPAAALARTLKRAASTRAGISFMLWWAIGVYLVLYVSAPVTVTPAMEAEVSEQMRLAETLDGHAEALDEWERQSALMDDARVWFWRWRPKYAERVRYLQPDYDAALAKVDDFESKRVALRRDALSVVGVWSDYGLHDARNLFWDTFEGTKSFAKRQTFWDMLFTVGRSSDDGLLGLVLRAVLTAAFNFTVGVVFAIFAFAWKVWGLLAAYNASLFSFSGLAFFTVSVLSAAAMLWTYVFVIYGTIVGGGAFVVSRAIKAQAAQRERLRYQQ